jgi:regulator of protease activity HflC (stomatin/prohibitin superfamily)
MVKVRGVGAAAATLKTSLAKLGIRTAVVVVGLAFFYTACLARVRPNEFGVEQRKFGFNKGIVANLYSPGLYFVGPGATMRTFPREIHVLEATYDLEEARSKARDSDTQRRVERYFEHRDEELGAATHRTIQAINVQTSDGYAVTVDLTLLYTITDPVRVAKDFGWGSLYVDSFVVNTFRNGILTTLGKMNAEAFYDGPARMQAVAEAQALLTQRFNDRGLKVERLLLRNVRYADNYEK